MKRTLIPFLAAMSLLTSCTSTARQVNKNYNSTPDVVETVQPTQENKITVTPSNPVETYNLNEAISSQLTGEIKENFEYLTQHLQDTDCFIQNIYHGTFTQNKDGELLVEYAFENPPSTHGADPTFLFVLDVFSGELLTSYYLTADSVDVTLLTSPLGAKLFILQNSLLEEKHFSYASLYSCLDGTWTSSSALTSHSTLREEEHEGEPTDYVYTYHGDTLTVESQIFSSENPESPPTLELFTTCSWNADLSIFQNNVN